jgi:MYXO-CTERM domain-containing protein
VTLNLGTKLAGKQLRLRFHVGSDTGAGASGWEIDNVAFRGITSTPFPILVADSGTCGVTPPDGGVPAPDGGVPPQDGGTGSGGGPTTDAGHGHGHDHDHGGHGHGHGHGGGVYGCQVGGSGSAGAGALLGLLAVLLRRRRP